MPAAAAKALRKLRQYQEIKGRFYRPFFFVQLYIETQPKHGVLFQMRRQLGREFREHFGIYIAFEWHNQRQ